MDLYYLHVLHFECSINSSFHCNTLYHTSAKKKKKYVKTHFKTPITHFSRCNTLQYTATRCNMLQYTLQHTAPHCCNTGVNWIFTTYTIQHFTLLTLRLILSALSTIPPLSFLGYVSFLSFLFNISISSFLYLVFFLYFPPSFPPLPPSLFSVTLLRYPSLSLFF